MEISKVLKQVQDRAQVVVDRATEELKSDNPKAQYGKRQDRLLKRIGRQDG